MQIFSIVYRKTTAPKADGSKQQKNAPHQPNNVQRNTEAVGISNKPIGAKVNNEKPNRVNVVQVVPTRENQTTPINIKPSLLNKSASERSPSVSSTIRSISVQSQLTRSCTVTPVKASDNNATKSLSSEKRQQTISESIHVTPDPLSSNIQLVKPECTVKPPVDQPVLLNESKSDNAEKYTTLNTHDNLKVLNDETDGIPASGTSITKLPDIHPISKPLIARKKGSVVVDMDECENELSDIKADAITDSLGQEGKNVKQTEIEDSYENALPGDLPLENIDLIVCHSENNKGLAHLLSNTLTKAGCDNCVYCDNVDMFQEKSKFEMKTIIVCPTAHNDRMLKHVSRFKWCKAYKQLTQKSDMNVYL